MICVCLGVSGTCFGATAPRITRHTRTLRSAQEGSEAAKKVPKVKGSLHYSDVSPSSSGPKLEVTHKLKKTPASEYAKRVTSAVEALQEAIAKYLNSFDAELKQRSI